MVLDHWRNALSRRRPRRASNRRRNAWTVQILDIQPDDHVLEIGYGPGLSIRHAAELASRGRVVGIDHSNVMQRQARRRNRQAVTAGRVQLRCGSVDDLTGSPAEFDKVLAVNVFMFWSDPVAVLRKVAELMLPSATIALTMQPRGSGVTNDDTRRAGARMAAALQEAGFTDVRVHTLPLKPVDAACATGHRPVDEGH